MWIGDGSDLKRVTGPRAVQTVALNVSVGKASGHGVGGAGQPGRQPGRAGADRPAAASQIYVGNIVRGTTEVSVNDLQPDQPAGRRVTDVAWNDQLKLFAIGSDLITRVNGVYEVQCDGSFWNSRGNTGLPQAPDTVTVASGSEAVVSAGGTLWQQSGNSGRAC